MNILRERLSENYGGSTSILNTSVSSPSSISGDESEKTQAIPSSLIKEQWQLILESDASISDLQYAIEKCKELVVNSNELSIERKWLVRHLVELRFRLRELQDIVEDPKSDGPNYKVILGHHFIDRLVKNLPTSKQYCDHCSGIIWNVVQASFICSDCSFCVHHKCISQILRVCAHVITSERKIALEEICPEVGIALQAYKCAECQTNFNFTRPKIISCGMQFRPDGTWVEPRICDYSGLYYCVTCHWNNTAIIPARVIHNWDFVPKKVGRASLQELNILFEKPFINLEERNPKLFVFVQILNLVKKLREDLCHMRKYLSECRIACTEKIIETNIGTKRYLIQCPDMYSVADLLAVENETLNVYLNKIYEIFDKHIRGCEICSGKGYLCEICGNNEVIFPWNDGSLKCLTCNSVVHRVCKIRKNMTCVKCVRIDQRKSLDVKLIEDEENGNERDSNVS